jgi:trans-2,3-dihydro-3-hydroxyanthranilate isomerase
MLAFARETKLSETTFVQSGDGESDYRNRIWMMAGELPFAGHPSLGTAVAVARRRGETSARYVQRTPAGLQPVEVELAGLVARGSMLQELAQFGAELDAGEALAAAGLAPGDERTDLPVQLVTTGLQQLLVPLRDAAALARARPQIAGLAPLLERTGATTLYVFVAGEAAADARSFFVSPGGIAEEDPATGSAAGPLLAYLHRRLGVEELSVTQGVLMGRSSRMDCSLEDGRVRVGGETVIVAEGTLRL